MSAIFWFCATLPAPNKAEWSWIWSLPLQLGAVDALWLPLAASSMLVLVLIRPGPPSTMVTIGFSTEISS